MRISGLVISALIMLCSCERLQDGQMLNSPNSEFGSCSRRGKCCKLDKQTSFEDNHSKQNFGPYFSLLPRNSFSMGKCIRIEGRVMQEPDSFYVSVQRGQSIQPEPIIAFYFNPLYSVRGDGSIRLNYKFNGTWGSEQRQKMPADLLPGSDFKLVIVCGFRSYHVYLNEKLIAGFKYKVDPDIADTVLVDGDVQLTTVALENYGRTICTQRQSIRDEQIEYYSELETPFYGLVPSNGFNVGKSIRIEGQVKVEPKYFYVNLIRGYNIWPYPTMTLHLTPRYEEGTDGFLVTNCCYNGHWVSEEVNSIPTDLYAGRNFSLVIARGERSYSVYVNKKRITEYVHRFNADVMDTILIHGEIHLWDVVIENFSLE